MAGPGFPSPVEFPATLSDRCDLIGPSFGVAQTLIGRRSQPSVLACSSFAMPHLRTASSQTAQHHLHHRTRIAMAEYRISKPAEADFGEWAVLFRAYIDCYESSVAEEQYRRTFDRILTEQNGLQALVVRQSQDGREKLVGLAHFFPEQTPWSDKEIMLLNDLFVDPAIRGQGLGRRLIQAVADIARQRGCLRLQWLTKYDNATARRLYDTLGDTQFAQYRMSLD